MLFRNLFAGLALFALFNSGCSSQPGAKPADKLEFTVAGDMREFTTGAPAGKSYFDGAAEAMKRVGPGSFLITPGDFDPPAGVRAVIDTHLGSAFPWYVVVGNHEVETDADMAWVQQWASNIPRAVRKGPPGFEFAMYSYEYAHCHFSVISSYPAYKDGNQGPVEMTDAMLEWLDADLAAASKPVVWVVGHQPIESRPDMDTKRIRHHNASVSANPERAAKFVAILKKHNVRGYICGHTHNVSVEKLNNGIWQLDSGHARGSGDTGSPSSFLKVRVEGERIWTDIYRVTDASSRNYVLRQTVELTK